MASSLVPLKTVFQIATTTTNATMSHILSNILSHIIVRVQYPAGDGGTILTYISLADLGNGCLNQSVRVDWVHSQHIKESFREEVLRTVSAARLDNESPMWVIESAEQWKALAAMVLLDSIQHEGCLIGMHYIRFEWPIAHVTFIYTARATVITSAG